MNKPQLSAEIKKLHKFIFTDWDIDATGSCEVLEKYVLHFLATALEEQRMQTEVKTGLNAFGVTMEEIAKARADERQKVLSEVEEWINQLPDWQWRVTKEALVAKLNQLKGSDDQPVRNA